jgi:hypothetical protein
MAFARNPAYNYADLMRRIAKRLGHADAIVRRPPPPPVAHLAACRSRRL